MAKITFDDKQDLKINPAPRINKIIADDINEIKASVNDLYDAVDQNTLDILGLKGATGWAVYFDTQYTSGSPLSLTGETQVNLPNNAGTKIESQIPTYITKMYDELTQKVIGRNGDGLNLTISFAVRPTTAALTRITVVPDIGGLIGEIEDYKDDHVFSKGNGVVQRYLSSFDAYTLDTWEANGAQLKVEASHACEIYGIRYLFTATHKAR